MSTRGYSVLKRRDYGLTSSYPCRRSPYTDDYAYESMRPRVYDTGFEREQSVLDSNVSRNIHVSSATLDDNYDVARISRSRDQQLLSHANQAIVSTGVHVSPKAAVASRRAINSTRAVSVPPSYVYPPTYSYVQSCPRRVVRQREVVLVPLYRTLSNQPTTALKVGARSTVKDSRYRALLAGLGGAYPRREVGSRGWSLPPISGRRAALVDAPSSGLSTWLRPHLRFLFLMSGLNSRSMPSFYVPGYWPYKPYKPQKRVKFANKAALVAGSVDVVLPKRAPKSRFAADKLRAMRRPDKEDMFSAAVPASSGLKASRPGRRPQSTEKVHRNADGFTNHKNLLSWQYRLDARANPEDLVNYQPKQYENMRDRVRDAQDKMDRHRQLIDRYLETDLNPDHTDVAAEVQSKYIDLESRNPSYFRSGVGSSSGGSGSRYSRTKQTVISY